MPENRKYEGILPMANFFRKLHHFYWKSDNTILLKSL
jgi:hypothetical protein